MTGRTMASLLAVLVSFACTGPVRAQSAEQPRTRPALRSAGPSKINRDASQTTATQGSAEVEDGGVVRVSTSLITVPAVVMDRNGRYVANLHREDFRLSEDGVEQSLSYFASIEKPFTVVLMLDVSGSTQFELTQIRGAANTFVSRLRFNDRLMVITFDGQVHVLTQPANVGDVLHSKLRIPPVSDGTVLYDAVDFAMKRLAEIPGRKAIVLLTDGVDQNSRVSLKENLSEATEQDILIYTVQYNTLPQLPQRLSRITNEKARRRVQERLMKRYAVSEPYLRALAEKTGGRFYRADDLSNVGPAFEAITAELGVQYSLGYYPKGNSNSGAQRAIKVRVRYPNLVVRARDGYSTNATIAKQSGGN